MEMAAAVAIVCVCVCACVLVCMSVCGFQCVFMAFAVSTVFWVSRAQNEAGMKRESQRENEA